MPRSAAAAAQKAEAQDGSVSFDFDGATYTVKNDVFDDLDVMLLFEEGKILSTVKAVLGPAQWQTFTSKKRNISTDFADFAAVLFKSLGTSTGESKG